jgi:hypothetical protein
MDLQSFNDEQKKVRREVWAKLVASLLAAFGFVVALAWNDAVKSALEKFFPNGSSDILPKFIYAILLTIAVALAGYYVSKWIYKHLNYTKDGLEYLFQKSDPVVLIDKDVM